MKKLLVLAVMVSMVMGFSFSAMAAAHQETAQLDVGIEIGEYFELGIVSEFFRGSAGNEPLFGLFNQENMIIGQPGIYVSDGGATVNRAQELFDSDESAINTVDQDGVEMVVVAANTDTNLDMTVDWGVAGLNEEFLRAFFRFSSNYPNMNDTFLNPVFDADYTFSDAMALSHYNEAMALDRDGFNNELLERGNISFDTFNRLGDAIGLEGYSWGTHRGYVGNWEGADEVDSIFIPYRACTPTLLHINGALEIMKATGFPAGEHNLGTINLTLSAANDYNGNGGQH